MSQAVLPSPGGAVAEAPAEARPRRAGFHFASLEDLCHSLGATRPIRRLLVANNGLAAVKGIDSIRAWLYEHLGDAEAIHFVVLATPEDLKANAEFISMAEQHVCVPGGPNGNNYANVDLIMHTALHDACDGIYPGWGHASENPALPRECARSTRVAFLGPSEDAMFALGDKIASTVVAQSNGVPTVPWSGDGIRLPPGIYEVDAETYDRAYVTTPAECEQVCRRIGFPVMIKASEGGGGKGIRRCNTLAEVKDMFFAVSEEVKGCHIFVMRLLEGVRHVEVQLLADDYDHCIAIHTRDCSVQRRHQKIIEEGPAYDVPAEVIAAMERAARQLARAVNYRGLGTVEYMYDPRTRDFYFLELNPRIQVEHPVSELIAGVNLPAALLCVAMGIRLDRIPEIRVFYGEEPYDTTPIDVNGRTPMPARCHTIAVRVTAEDTDEDFRPTSGKVEEISFKNSRECWGYFSIGSGGEVHAFADSQFGHIFSSGETREEARRGMVLALRNLVIRGEIRTSSSYVLELLETPEFCEGRVSTAWLDARLAAAKSVEMSTRPSVHLALLAASVFRSLRSTHEQTNKYTSFLSSGHVPSTDYLANNFTESYVNRSEKYTTTTGRVGPSTFAVALNGSVVTVPYRILKSGDLQLTIGDRALVAYVREEPSSIRITIGGKSTNFIGDVDPTKLLAAVPGRLVRFVIDHDAHIHEGGTFAEVEVMKMILPLRASTSGVLHHRAAPGTTIVLGTLLAEITPDDPSKVARPHEVQEPWPAELLRGRRYERLDGVTRARRAVETLWDLVEGYHFRETPLEERLRQAFEGLSAFFLSSVTLRSTQLPFLPTEADAAQTPNEKLTAVLDAVVARYVTVERAFDGRTRPEALELLRGSRDSSEEVYEVDFAHHQDCHHGVVKGILGYVEPNHAVLKLLRPTLSLLVSLQSYTYGSLLLQARYLLRQSELPSFADRKALFARELEEGALQSLLESSYGYDLLCSILFDRQMAHLIQVGMEFFIHRECFAEGTVTEMDIFKAGGTWFATYRLEPASGPEPLETDVPTTTWTALPHAGVCMVCTEESNLRGLLLAALKEELGHVAPRTTMATVFFSTGRTSTQEEVAHLCGRALDGARETMRGYPALQTVFFVVHGMEGGPHFFTFRRTLHFTEDTLIRNIVPQSVRRLELDRLSNFDVTMYPTPYKEVHLFRAVPRKGGCSPNEHRLFARVVITPHDMGLAPWTVGTDVDAGRMLAKCLAALEFAHAAAVTRYPPSNHVFVKLIELSLDVTSLKRLLLSASSFYRDKLLLLGVNEVELAFHVKLPSGLVPMRVFVCSPSGYNVFAHVYYECVEGGTRRLRRAESSEDILSRLSSVIESPAEASPHNGSFSTAPRQRRTISKLEALSELLPKRPTEDAEDVELVVGDEGPRGDLEGDVEGLLLKPYPPLSPESVRQLEARAAHTTYVHDWPSIFHLILKKEWRRMRARHGWPPSAVPARCFHATQLFFSAADARLTSTRVEGAACGMVAWHVEYQPPRYYDATTGQAASRRVVMVANDITVSSGSFAVPEDEVFRAACCLAREERIPFVYISANSGARLGLSAEVKRRFLVAFTEKKEIDYLYLRAEDYEELRARHVGLDVEERLVGAEVRYVIHGVVGAASEYLGVENLRGSGLVAGHMSANYHDIPTISIVTGRSVGIGAYLNRLGRRVIQTGDSPLILTGAGALNRLLGKDIYINNSQLGGRQVMVPNGVTHWCTQHDYASAKTLLRWLDYVPPTVHPSRCAPRRLVLSEPDPIDRDVTYTPEPNSPYDPRNLVTGWMEKTGLFDRLSWMECLAGWAKTVVTGRATLGGIPCGVILVETRSTKKLNPADPADPTSTSSFVTQAGQVWFPDSARKTADALEDFHRERLPCFILANWRGFSGGMRDMYDEVLKFGASIVDNLRVYTAPVFIYIPPFGELRGGAWVVVDPLINHNGAVEMYCDPTSRGGILEPAGVVEIKFRDSDVRELIRRCQPELSAMDPTGARQIENDLLPRFRDVAVRLADLHDTHVRMKATGAIREAIPWKDSRRCFYHKLQRKLKELSLAQDLVEAGAAADLADAVGLIEAHYQEDHPSTSWGTDDVAQLDWLTKVQDAGWRGHTRAAPVETTPETIRAMLRACEATEGGLERCLAELLKDPAVARAAKVAMHSMGTPQGIGEEN